MRKILTHLLLFIFLLLFRPVLLSANEPLKTALHTKAKNALPLFASQPITICSGAPIVIKGDAATPTPDTYSWEVLQGSTWLNAPGVNSTADYTASLLVNNTITDMVFNIRRKIIVAGVVSYDSYFDVTVQPSAPITNNTINTPAVNSFCSPGNPATITGSNPNGGNGNFSYQWQSSADNVSFANISGANSSVYIPPILTSTTYYRRVISGGSCITPSLSNTIGILIFQPASNNIVTAPAGNTFCTPADAAAITGNIPSGGDGTFAYQWQVSNNNTAFSDIAGATLKDYDPPLVSVTTYYRRSAISGLCNTPAYSNSVAVTILPALGGNTISAPAIVNFCVTGDAASINGSTPTGGSGVYNYQWQQSTDNLSFTDVLGANARDFDPPAISVTTYYRRAVTSAQCLTPVLSNAVTVNIQPIPVVPVLSQTTVTICSGNTATLTVSSPQAGMSYNWYDSPTKTTLLFTGPSYTTPAQSVNKTYYVEASNGVCASSSLATVQVVIAAPVPVLNNSVAAPATNVFCSVADPAVITGSTPTGGIGVYTYQWQSSTDNITYTNIPGATAQDYDPPSISVTTYYRRSVMSGTCSVPAISSPVSVAILPAISNNSTTAPSVTIFCVTADASLIVGTTPFGGAGVFAYQWQQSTDNVTFTDIPGATAKDYDPPVVSVTTYFKRIVTSGQCLTPIFSNLTTITVQPLPVAPVPAAATVTICSGNTATLSVSSPQAGFVYRWYDSPIKTTLLFSGISYTTPAQTINKTYYVESSNGICTSSALANVQVVIAVPAAVLNNVVTPPVTNVFCAAADPAVITGTTPTGGIGVYTYQWQSSTDNVNFTDIPGAVAQNYDPAAISITTYYRRSVLSGSCSVPTVSNAIPIAIFPPVVNNNITAPSVTTFCLTADASIVIGNTPSGGTGVYTYQWQQSTDNVTFTDIPGINTKDYDPPIVSATTYLRRIVTSGQCLTPLISNVTIITVQPLPIAPVPSASTVTICSGNTATLSVSSPQAGFVYRWYDSPAKTTLLFTGISYTTPIQTINTTYYVESSNGICTSSTLASVQVVIAVPAAVLNNVLTPPVTNVFCAAADPAIITGTTPTGGIGVYTYQWQSSTDNANFTDIPGAVAQNYDPAAISVTTYYRRSVLSGSCSVPTVSGSVPIAIFPPVVNNSITSPSVTLFCITADASLVVGNSPSGGTGAYTYQWQQSTDNINFTDIPGINTKDYDPPVVSTTTYFRRVVTSGQCLTPLISNVTTVTVQPLPVVPVPTLSNVSVCSGNVVTLSVSSPQAGLVYRWYDSATKTTLLFTGTSYTTPAQTTNNTFYVDSYNGTCASSALATVQVIIAAPPTAPAVLSSIVNTCSNSPAILSVSNPQAGFSYNWYQSATGGALLYSGVNYLSPALTANAIYYVETANAGGCASVRTPVTVNINPLPQVTVQSSSACSGSAVTLSATANVANATINWFSSLTGGSFVYTGNSLVIAALTNDASYYIEVINNATGCTSATRQLIQAKVLHPLAAPIVSAGAATSNTVTFNWFAVSDAQGYEVSIDNGATYTQPSSGANGLLHTVSGLRENQTITILVRALGVSACQLSGNSVAVTAKTEGSLSDEVFVANAFTPNGDGNNDRVYVRSESIKTLTFYVYNQWGEMLFSSANQANGWDGTFKGVKEPAGVYIYYLNAVMNNGRLLNKKGTITLIR